MFQLTFFPQVFICKTIFYQIENENFKIGMIFGRERLNLIKSSQSNVTFQVIKEKILR